MSSGLSRPPTAGETLDHLRQLLDDLGDRRTKQDFDRAEQTRYDELCQAEWALLHHAER